MPINIPQELPQFIESQPFTAPLRQAGDTSSISLHQHNISTSRALKIDTSLNRNVVAYKTVIAPGKQYITPGVAMELCCSSRQSDLLQEPELPRPATLQKDSVAEDLIVNGCSSGARLNKV